MQLQRTIVCDLVYLIIHFRLHPCDLQDCAVHTADLTAQLCVLARAAVRRILRICSTQRCSSYFQEGTKIPLANFAPGVCDKLEHGEDARMNIVENTITETAKVGEKRGGVVLLCSFR